MLNVYISILMLAVTMQDLWRRGLIRNEERFAWKNILGYTEETATEDLLLKIAKTLQGCF